MRGASVLDQLLVLAQAPEQLPPMQPGLSGGPLLTVLIVVGLLIYGIGRLGEAMFLLLKRRGSARVVWIDPDAGGVNIEWVKRVGNEVTAKVAGEQQTFILDGKARLSGKWPTWIINSRRGWNYIAAPDADTVHADTLLQALAPNNPGAYYHAISHNEARDSLEANKGGDSMWVQLAPFMLIALVLIMAILGWIAWKISSGVTAAAPPGA